MRVVGMRTGTGRFKNRPGARCQLRFGCWLPGPRSHYGRNYRSQLIAASEERLFTNDFHANNGMGFACDAGMLAFSADALHYLYCVWKTHIESVHWGLYSENIQKTYDITLWPYSFQSCSIVARSCLR
jgi:hypothetical protein